MRTGLSVFVRERILGASLQYITNLLVARVDFPFLKRRLWAVPFFIIQFLPRPHSHDHKEYFAQKRAKVRTWILFAGRLHLHVTLCLVLTSHPHRV